MRNESMRNKRPAIPAYAAPSLSHRFNWPTVGRKKRQRGRRSEDKELESKHSKKEKKALMKRVGHTLEKCLMRNIYSKAFEFFLISWRAPPLLLRASMTNWVTRH